MNSDLETLGREAVACPLFRWTPGMLAVIPAPSDGATGYIVRITEGTGPVNSARAYPDFSDAATLGALLGLVREAEGDPTIFLECHPLGARWQAHCVDGGIFGQGETEPAALVAALQTAASRELEALAFRAVAAPRFEWASGMQYRAGGRLFTPLNNDDFFGAIVLPPDHIPNLSDPRTLAILARMAGLPAGASPAEIVAALEKPRPKPLPFSEIF